MNNCSYFVTKRLIGIIVSIFIVLAILTFPKNTVATTQSKEAISTYTIALTLDCDVTLTAKDTNGYALKVAKMGYTPKGSTMEDYIVLGCNGTTTLEFTTKPNVTAPTKFSLSATCDTQDGKNTPLFRFRDIPISPGEVKKAVVYSDGTAAGTKIRPFFKGKDAE
jgi:hypothetical protein